MQLRGNPPSSRGLKHDPLVTVPPRVPIPTPVTLERWPKKIFRAIDSPAIVAAGQPAAVLTPPMPHYIDLHSHYLPGLDDGATDMGMSMDMIRTVTALGFSQ